MKNRCLLLLYFIINMQSLFCQFADTKIEDRGSFPKQPINYENAVQSVNQFTGDVSLSYPLVNLKGKHGLDLNVSLQYTSNVRHILGTDNSANPTGWLGLGWSLEFGSIVVDHNQTVSIYDDQYYWKSPNGTMELKPINQNFSYGGITYKEFKLQNDIYTKIGYNDQTNGGWIVFMGDGTIYYFGGTWSKKICHWGNWIGNSKETPSGSVPYAWEINYIENIHGDRINFEHQMISESILSTGFSFTKESYISKITDTYGFQVFFNTANKEPNEFVDLHSELTPEPDAYQEIFERKYLSSVEVKNFNNQLQYRYEFENDQTKFIGTGNYKKRVLTRVKKYDKNNVLQPSDYFIYKTNTEINEGALAKIEYGTGASVNYNYSEIEAVKTTLAKEVLFEEVPIYFNEYQENDRYRTYIHTSQNYVVISNHNDEYDKVHIWAYYWEGRWLGGYLGYYNTRDVKWDVSDIDNDEPTKPFHKREVSDKNNLIVLSKEFFVINTNALSETDEGRDESVYIWYWDHKNLQWKNSYNDLQLTSKGMRQDCNFNGNTVSDFAAYYDVAVG